MGDNVWASGQETSTKPERIAIGETEPRPDVVKIATDMFNHFKNDIWGYTKAGSGFGVLFFAMIIGIMVMAFGGVILMENGDEEMGMMLILGMYAVIIPFSFALVLPMVSLMRAMDASLHGEGELGFGAPFSTMFQDLGKVLGLILIQGVLSMIGMMLCIIPGYIVMIALGFALPGVVLDRLGPVEALQRAWTHAKENASWHLAYFFLGMAILMIVQYIPLVGILWIYPMYFAYQCLAYRRVFGFQEEN